MASIYSNDFEHLSVGDKPADVTYQYNTATDSVVELDGNNVFKITGSSGNGADLVTKISDSALPDETIISGRMYLEPVANPDQFGGWTSDELGELSSNLAGFAAKQYGDAGAQQARIVVFYRPADDKYYAYTQNGDTNAPDIYAEISTGEWIDMRFETDFGNNQVTVFINDVNIGTVQTLSMSAGDAAAWGTEPAVKYNGGNSTSTTTYFDDVEVSATLPDLRHTHFRADATDYGELQTEYVLRNADEGDAPESTVTWYWSSDLIQGNEDDIYIGEADLPALAGNSQRPYPADTFNFSVNPWDVHYYGYVYAIVDEADEIAESDETNNAVGFDGVLEHKQANGLGYDWRVVFEEDFDDGATGWTRISQGAVSSDNSFGIVDQGGDDGLRAELHASNEDWFDYFKSESFESLDVDDSFQISFDITTESPGIYMYPRIFFASVEETGGVYDIEEGILFATDWTDFYDKKFRFQIFDESEGLEGPGPRTDGSYEAGGEYRVTIEHLSGEADIVGSVWDKTTGDLVGTGTIQMTDLISFDHVLIGDHFTEFGDEASVVVDDFLIKVAGDADPVQADLTYSDDLVEDSTLDYGQNLVVDLLVGNNGDTVAEAVTTFYWSDDGELSDDDVVISTFNHGEIAGMDEVDSQDIEISFEKLAAKGDGYLIPVLDAAGEVDESDETNNTGNAIAYQVEGCVEVLFEEDFENFQGWDRVQNGDVSVNNAFEMVEAGGNSYLQATIEDGFPTMADYLVSPTFVVLTDEDSWELEFDLYLEDPADGVYPRIGFINGDTTVQYEVEAPAEGIMVRAETRTDLANLYYYSWDHVADTNSGLVFSEPAYEADTWYTFTLTNDAATGTLSVIVQNEDGSLFDENSIQLVEDLSFDRVMFGDYQGREAEELGNTEILGVDNIRVTRVTEFCENDPDLQITSFDVEDDTLSEGEDLFVSFDVENAGVDTAYNVETKVYWSATSTFDQETATLLLTEDQGKMEGGETDTDEGGRIRYEALEDLGDGYLFAVVDPEDAITETDEDNNVSAGIEITVEGAGAVEQADFVMSSFGLAETDLGDSGKVAATVTVDNAGDDRAYARTTYFYSTDDQFDANDIEIADDGHGTLRGGEDVTETKKLKVKNIAEAAEVHAVQTGDHYILAVVDADGKVDESDEDNNVAAVEVTIDTSGTALLDPDLVMSSFALDETSVGETGRIQATVDVENAGGGKAYAKTTYFYSTDDTWDAEDIAIKSDGHGSLKATESTGEQVRGLNAKKIRAAAEDHANQTGDHFIIAVVDAAEKIVESDETNNALSLEIDIPEPGQADLAFIDLVLQDNSLAYEQRLEFQVTTTNLGTAAGRVKMEYFLSEDAVLDDGDLRIRADSHSTLEAGESDTGPMRKLNFSKIEKNLADGDGYLLAVIDRSDRVEESDEDNNVIARAFTFEEAAEADLQITESSLTDSVLADGEDFKVQLGVKNGGQVDAHGAQSTIYWNDDETFDFATAQIIEIDNHGKLAAGEEEFPELTLIRYEEVEDYGSGYIFAYISGPDADPDTSNNLSDAMELTIL